MTWKPGVASAPSPATDQRGLRASIRVMMPSVGVTRLDRATAKKLHPGKGESLDLGRGRESSSRAQRSAIESRDGIGVDEGILELAVRRSKTRGGEGAAKGVA